MCEDARTFDTNMLDKARFTEQDNIETSGRRYIKYKKHFNQVTKRCMSK